MKIGNRNFDVKNHTYVMGILNMTPDSFSDGGKYNDSDQALFHVEKMQREGMDILDIGGESTRPGYLMLTDEEEIERIVPIIEKVRKCFDIPISLDTYKAKVAQAGLCAGCDMINDIWGLRYDSAMAGTISEADVACVLMHNRKNPEYNSFQEDVKADLKLSLAAAAQAGIQKNKIILDPGVGFAKSVTQNLQLIQELEKFSELGYPLLLGTSRKSVIGKTLDLPVSERLEGTLVTTVLAVQKHCAFVRVHDIKENVRAIKMAEAIFASTQETSEWIKSE